MHTPPSSNASCPSGGCSPIAVVQQKTCPVHNSKNLKCLSEACLAMGFLSIIISIATWFAASKQNSAYGERFGIFIGLWVPSFFILSNRLSRKSDEIKTCCR